MFEQNILRRFEEEGSDFFRMIGDRLPLFADTLESDDEVLVLIDLPGCERESIELNFKKGKLEVAATRQKPLEEGFRYVTESRPEFIEGKVPINADVNADEASATYEDGLLKVRIPKETGEEIEIE